MRSEEFYDFSSEECLASYLRAKHLCAKLQTMPVRTLMIQAKICETPLVLPQSHA